MDVEVPLHEAGTEQFPEAGTALFPEAIFFMH